MCEPATIAMGAFALSALSTGASLYGQQQQAKAQGQANQRQYESDMTAYRGNLAANEVTRGQLQQQATEQINANNAAGRRAASTAATSAGESGVSGLSVEALLRDLEGQAGYDNTNVESNYLRQNTALNAERENIHNNTVSQINTLKTPTMPDYLGAGLRLGQAGLSSYSGYQQQQAIIAGKKG